MKLEDAIKTTKFSSQKHKATLNIMYSAWWLKTAFSKSLKSIGLTLEQYNVLRILKGKHPEKMCVRDIGSRMIEPSSNVPRIVDRLVAKKFAERTTSDIDKRETVTNLTSLGINILESAGKLADTWYNSEVELNEEDAATLNTILENMQIKE